MPISKADNITCESTYKISPVFKWCILPEGNKTGYINTIVVHGALVKNRGNVIIDPLDEKSTLEFKYTRKFNELIVWNRKKV